MIIGRGRGPYLSYDHYVGVLKQITALKSVCSHLFFFAVSKLFDKHHPTLKKTSSSSLPPFFLFFYHSSLRGILLCNHISRSFVTALSPHAMCLSPKKDLFCSGDMRRGVFKQTFCQNKDSGRKQIEYAFVIANVIIGGVCLHRSLRIREWINDNETSLSPIRFPFVWNAASILWERLPPSLIRAGELVLNKNSSSHTEDANPNLCKCHPPCD